LEEGPIIFSLHQIIDTNCYTQKNIRKMKHLFSLLIVILVAGSAVQAQNMLPTKGDVTLSAGIGLVPTFLSDKGTVNVIPVQAMVGYRISDAFSLSAYVGYSAATSQTQLEQNVPVEYRNDLLVTGLRAEVHSTRFDRVDVYGAFMLGYYHPMVTRTVVDHTIEGEPVTIGGGPSKDAPYRYAPPKDKVLISGFVGASYHMNKRWSAFAEVGYGISLANAGFQFRF
jgi:hypothetical protein